MDYSKLFEQILKKPVFYHYLGGLTTPPCTETVIWFVYTEVLSVKLEDIKQLKDKWVGDKKFSNGKGNSRIVQDICGREIYKISANE